MISAGFGSSGCGIRKPSLVPPLFSGKENCDPGYRSGDGDLFAILFDVNSSFRQNYHTPSAQLECKQMVILFNGINHVGYTNFSVKVQQAVPYYISLKVHVCLSPPSLYFICC